MFNVLSELSSSNSDIIFSSIVIKFYLFLGTQKNAVPNELRILALTSEFSFTSLNS